MADEGRARQLREAGKRHLISALDVLDVALRDRAVAERSLLDNRADLDMLRRIPAETWAKVLYDAAAIYRPEYVEWSKAPERPLYRTLGSAVVQELHRRIRAPLPPALPLPQPTTNEPLKLAEVDMTSEGPGEAR